MPTFNSLFRIKIYEYNIIEFILIIFFLGINYFGRLLIKGVIEANFLLNIAQFGLMIFITIILISYSRWRLGPNDYRFKLVVHILPALLSILSMGVFAGVTNTSFRYSETGLPTDQLIRILLVISLPLIFYILLLLNIIFSISDEYIDEFDKLTNYFVKGSLTSRIDNEMVLRDAIFGKLAKIINDLATYANNLIKQVADTSRLIATSSEDLSSGSEEVNASAEEVASTSQSMSDGASSQSELIYSVNQNIDEMQRIMNDIIKKIQLNTQEVSQIALQTNILALNAGIEASRAGDYGRGFAVVAENVRKLSDQSKMASERIETVADQIRETLQTSFNSISNTMINVVAVSEETAASAEEVAAAAEEMTATMEGISRLSIELSQQAAESNKLLSSIST